MSPTIVAILVAVGFVVLVVVLYRVARRGARDISPGVPDRVSGDIVSGLMTELKKAQAETAYWRSTAERLQREVDDRT